MNLVKQHKSFLILLLSLILLNSTAIMMTPMLLNQWINQDINIGIRQVGSIAILLVFSYIIQIILIYLREKFALNFNIHQATSLTKKFFGLTYDDINTKGPTYYLERIAISVNSLYIYLTDGFVQMVVNVIIVCAIIVLVLTFNQLLAVILLGLLPINYFGYRSLNKELQKRSKVMQEETSSGWKDILNLCKETDYIKQLATKDALLETMKEPFTRIYSSIAKVNSFAQGISATLCSFNELMKNLMILLLAYGVIVNGESPLSIVLFSIILPLYFNAINGITNANLASRDLKESSRFIEYLDENQENSGTKIISSIEKIEFNIKNLSIGNQTLKSNIQGIFEKGDIVSVNGDSGTGKSTLMKLLPKFRVTDTVLINSIDIRDISNESLRKQLVYMSQEVPIVTGTLRDNLFLGRAYNDKEINQLIKLPILQSILSNKSLDTVIEENGANLSGGEKQKIALSRVIFNEANVFVLDEITSNIDKETAGEIYKTIMSINEDKITFIVSHDKMHLPYCNKVIDLQ